MVWDSHLFKNVPQLVVICTVKGLGVVKLMSSKTSESSPAAAAAATVLIVFTACPTLAELLKEGWLPPQAKCHRFVLFLPQVYSFS